MAEYISVEGAARMEAEVERLFYKERPQVVANVTAAAAEGDRSENAEYIYGKKRMHEIDRRVSFLNRRLNALTSISEPTTSERVVFLSWVELEDQDGEVRVYRIVGADESDPTTDSISYRAPIGQALLGKHVDDEVRVQTPRGLIELVVLSIGATRP